MKTRHCGGPSDGQGKKKILLNAFNMNCIGHINHGLWTHPRDTSTQYKTIEYWTELAQLLERGLFDGLFIADIVGVYDVYQNSVDVPLKESIQLPVNDPLLLVSAMAAVTKNLGFGLTANLTYEAPYLFARRMSTLDHLSRGRVGWNIVTGYLDSAAKAMGLSEQVEHDRRYDQADEYLEVLYKLWEGSWENGAVLNDPQQRIYAQPEKVHKVEHKGEFYQVEGYHLCEPSPQRTPVLFQAGSSDRGLLFAGRHAECVFISGQNKPSTKVQVDKVRASAVEAGRNPEDIKVFMGLNVIVGADRRTGLGQARRVPELRQCRGRRGAFLGLHRHRFFRVRHRRADPVREEQRDPVRHQEPAKQRLDPPQIAGATRPRWPLHHRGRLA